MSFVDTVLIQPLLNILVFFYSVIPDFGVAIILLTLLIRGILWPLASKALRSQKAMTMLQPEINALRKKHKDPQALSKALMELYKEKEVSPFGSCLPVLLQIPFMLGLFWALIKLQDPNFVQLGNMSSGIQVYIYDFLRNISFVKDTLTTHTSINTTIFGWVDLAKPSLAIAILAGLGQFVQTKMMTPKNPQDQTQAMMSKMILLFPILTIVFGTILPGALPLYWFTMTLVAIVQQYLIMHRDVEYMEHLKGEKKK